MAEADIIFPDGRPPSQSCDVSLVVCTRDRPDQLEHCLASIASAAAQVRSLKIELIVVDNSAGGSAAGIIGRWAGSANIPVIAVFEKQPGLSRARNAGINVAQGRLLVFTDDDCRLAPDFFGELIRVHAQLAVPAIIGGKVLRGADKDLEFTVRGGEAEEHFNCSRVPGGFLLGCNMSMSREIWARIGGFDERLGAGSTFRAGEDTDYLIRAYNLAILVLYVPGIVVHHHHGRSTREEILPLQFGYSVANGALYAKHWKSSPWLRRQLRWVVWGCIREMFSGRQFDEQIGLSYFPVLLANIRGMIGYFTHSAGPSPHRSAPGTRALQNER